MASNSNSPCQMISFTNLLVYHCEGNIMEDYKVMLHMIEKYEWT